jgi:MFS family permease
MRKTAWRFVPVLFLAYIFNYLDRINVGFASLTMNKDLGLTATQFGLGAGLMFVSYCLFEVPSNLVMYRFGARRWIARIMISWGIAAAATMYVVGPRSFYLIRFVLGAAEAGFHPAVIFFFAQWFPAQYRPRVIAWFLGAIPISSLLGGPLCGLLLQMNGFLGLAGWKWLFILEGVPAVFTGIATFYLLGDEPKTASWLNAAERTALVTMLAEEKRERPHRDLLAALKDARVLILSGIIFTFTLGSISMAVWLPQILKGYGLSTLKIGFVASIPYFFGIIASIIWARYAGRTGKAELSLTIAMLVTVVGLVFSVLSGALLPALVGITIGLIGLTSSRAVFWSIPPNFLTGIAAAGGIAFINSVGNLGGLAGPVMVGYLKDRTGSPRSGVLGMAVVLLLGTLLAALLRAFVSESKKKPA